MRNLVMFILVTMLISCDSWIDPGINIDNNKLSEENTKLQYLLPNIELGYAYIVGGFDVVGQTGILTNKLYFNTRSELSISHYLYSSDNFYNLWNSLYQGIMMDCKKVIELAGHNSPHYTGIAKIILAATLGQTTSLFGDIPYSEAFLGMRNIEPKYDNQQTIYESINSLLNEAIDNLDAPKSENKFTVSNDLIFNNNIEKWKKTAYTLKARFAMHLSKKDEVSTTTRVLSALANGINSSEDDAQFRFHGIPTGNFILKGDESPMYQFINQRSGYLEIDPDFHDFLVGDPRADVLANSNLEKNSYLKADASIPIITYVEACFLKAEAIMMQLIPDKNAAALAYNNGLEASLKSLGVYGDGTWFNANKLDETTITRELILREKYIALTGTIEPFNDWRRTNIPILIPNQPNINNNKIPVRFLYPSNEVNFNTNCPKGITINDMPWAYK